MFGIGPAGTGKTYLAVAMAVSALLSKRVTRIILTRPAVEAGEKLGFLPGSLQEKVDPYLRPLYDALYDMLDPEKVKMLLERNTIEVAPLAFMRGRTLSDAFIIMDEAQNSTPEQMKMALTRQGFNSKMVVTGDTTQIDLPGGLRSGLIEVMDMLRGVEGISFVQFDDKDVVRHSLVQKIVRAYERYNEAIGANRQLSLKLIGSRRRVRGNRASGRTARAWRSTGRLRAIMSPDDPHLLFRHSSRRVRRKPLRDFLNELEKRVARGRAITCLVTTDAELKPPEQPVSRQELRYRCVIVPAR